MTILAAFTLGILLGRKLGKREVHRQISWLFEVGDLQARQREVAHLQ